ncbi:MAG: site-2 protease family protein [Selenomonadaceae bacterium]|nr:site-2 protease family protein [Selenomonadaceae bacterium]MBR0283670.1 site-2 protease family protein [Selenomonadaceae bacterium]MBR6342945.1 site-2 protease family protein [Selenomonadaceae bacterium]MBR6905630.1 site-2 protease family protein [Selenomonadaceae bacterium]
MFDFNLLQIVAGLPGLIIAMVVHEYAHARVAVAMGDFTPRLMGRLTFNPVAHIDPIGLLMLFLVHFGWAKPVTINPNNFRNPRRDDILVSLAGPGANLLAAFLALLIMALCFKFGYQMSTGMRTVFSLIMIYNINFAIFNMIPIPPLDGSHVLKQLLPYDMAMKLQDLERYSIFILIAIMMTPILGGILIPMQQLILGFFELLLSPLF